MKTTNKILKRLVVLTFALCATQCLKADQTSDQNGCWNTYTQQDNSCTAAQAVADNGFLVTYSAKILQDAIDEATADQNDYITETNAELTCHSALWLLIGNPKIEGDIGSCGRAQKQADDAAKTDFANKSANCDATQTTQSAIDQCVCPLKATRDFTIAKDAATHNQCVADAKNLCDNNCIETAKAVQRQADSKASAEHSLADSKAWADYSQKTTLQDGYTTPLCEYKANVAYNNCMDGVDCHYNANNCCADNAAIAYNNSLSAAFEGLVNTLGPADALYHHDFPLCSAQQGHDDQIASADCTFTEDKNLIAKNTTDGTANNLLTYNLAMNEAQLNEDVANCDCNASQSNPALCKAAAAVKKVNNDQLANNANLSVTGEPPLPPGSAYTTWFTGNQTAEGIKNGIIAQDANTGTACQTKAQTAFNQAYNKATALYQTQSNAAYQAYLNQLNGCNQG